MFSKININTATKNNAIIAKLQQIAASASLTMTTKSDQGNFAVCAIREYPKNNLSFYSTIGLSDYGNLKFGDYQPGQREIAQNKNFILTEIAGVCDSELLFFSDILVECKKSIVAEDICSALTPGYLIRNVVRKYYPQTTTPHVFLFEYVVGSDWLPKKFSIEENEIKWLATVAVSEEESQYAKATNLQTLNMKFVFANITINDIMRTSVI